MTTEGKNLSDEFQKQEDPLASKRKKQYGRLQRMGLVFLEFIKIVVLAAVAVWFIRVFVFKPFVVRGESMYPTFQEKEYLIIDEVSYRFKNPERGEVVVFESPTNNKDFYLKRIIALPGERVKIEEGKVIVINEEFPQGKILEEPYLEKIDTPGNKTVTLGPNQYFVLGDNRDASFDSRRFGPVSSEAIVGRTWFRGLPITRINIIKKPDYSF